MIIDPQLNLAELARPLLPELWRTLLPGPGRWRSTGAGTGSSTSAWRSNCRPCCQKLLPGCAAARSGLLPLPPAPRSAVRRCLPLGAAFAAGAGLAAVARKRRQA
jgi:hypothetical protein